ncbi:hypothetical protein [Luteococcus sp. OSA5]|uniref:hypothetical protein n=1 Tax=Luteococcus sp. OSA5 TaxID=3401630 RepID=UPI003B42EE3A
MRKLTSLLVLACLLAACSPDPDPGPPPATTPAATASSTTPSAAASNPSTDPMYLEAVEVYKAYFAEVDKAEMSGFEPESVADAIDPYLAEPLKGLVESAYQGDRELGFRPKAESGAKITSMAPNPGIAREGSITSLRVCVDASHVTMVDKASGQDVGTGRKTYNEVYFKREKAQLKAFIQDSEVVNRCPM